MSEADEKRVITKEYLQLFVHTIQNGGQITFVEEDNLLAVDHPTRGFLVLQIKDEVKDE